VSVYSGGSRFKANPRQVVHKTLSQKLITKKRGDGAAQGKVSELKSQYHQKNKIRNSRAENSLSVSMADQGEQKSW
jgi:hypothetical protein